VVALVSNAGYEGQGKQEGLTVGVIEQVSEEDLLVDLIASQLVIISVSDCYQLLIFC
jgi:hypothetical protein